MHATINPLELRRSVKRDSIGYLTLDRINGFAMVGRAACPVFLFLKLKKTVSCPNIEQDTVLVVQDMISFSKS